MPFSKQIVYVGDYAEEARKLQESYGRTDLYSTGHEKLDQYFRGGFGRKNGYEVVVLYGPTGIGKSMVGLNFLVPAIKRGVKVGMLVLEDDMADASVRMSFMMSADDYRMMNANDNVLCLPHEELVKSWKLDDLLEYIEFWFTKAGVDLIFLDHLQFAFENAEALKGENEYVAQRVFMQKLNQIVKKLNKSIILVSHVNKGVGKGMDKIVGSGSIAQAATKVIEVAKDDVSGQIRLNLRKSRFTSTPDYHYVMKLTGAKMEPAA